MVSIEESITTSVNHEFDLLNMHIDKNDLLIPASPIFFCLFQPCSVSVTAMQKYDLAINRQYVTNILIERPSMQLISFV